MRWAIATVLATVVMFFWGWTFWSATGLMEKAVLAAEDDLTAGEALREHFPDSGMYFVPGFAGDPTERETLHLDGPVAIVHMVDPDGRPMMDPGMLYSGFCHMMLTCIFLCMLLGMVANSVQTWLPRVGFFLFVGFVMAFYHSLGEMIWWNLSWKWQLVEAVYDWSAIALAGLVIATIAPRGGRTANLDDYAGEK